MFFVKKISPNLSTYWFAWPGYMLFFLMLFVPSAYQTIKAILLGIILAISAVKILLSQNVKIHFAILARSYLIIITGITFMSLGFFYGNSDAFQGWTVYVLWPFVYTVLVAAIADNIVIINKLLKILVFSSIAIGIYSIDFLLFSAGWLPTYLYIELDAGQAYGFRYGEFGYRLYSINSIIFLLPFLMTALFTWQKDVIIHRIWLWLAFMLLLPPTILSGRRGLWLVIPIALFIILLNYTKSKRGINSKFLFNKLWPLAMLLFGLCTYILFRAQITYLVNHFFVGFEFSSETGSASIRRYQFFSLLDAWQDNWLLGSGMGANAEYIRSLDQPWAYELLYIALLFQTGIIGFSIYGYNVIWLIKTSFKLTVSESPMRTYMFPVFVGTCCFLIASATNPYIATFDYIWVIFLPIAILNVCFYHYRTPST